MSRKAFVAKADAICTQSQKRVETEFTAFLKKNHVKETGEKKESQQEAEARSIEAIETVGIPQLQRQLDELRALEAPAGEEAKMTAYLDALEEEIEAGEKDAKTLFGPAEKIFAKSEAAAKGLGFEVCAKGNA